MQTIPKLITDRSITFFLDGGKSYTLDRDSDFAPLVIEELNKMQPDPQRLVELVDQSRAIKTAVEETMVEADRVNYLTKGVIDVTRAGVTYNGELIHNALADRLMDVMAAGLRIAPWIRFAENVYQNPADFARDELYLWLEKSTLPITDDGHFLAYKIVGPDFKDLWSGKFDNSPGQVVQLAGRHQVDPVRDRTCSYGLHFCSKDYLPHYGTRAGNRVVIVKINPADVVSIPSDYDNAKGRTWRYEVLEEIDRKEAATKTWGPVWPAPTTEPVEVPELNENDERDIDEFALDLLDTIDDLFDRLDVYPEDTVAKMGVLANGNTSIWLEEYDGTFIDHIASIPAGDRLRQDYLDEARTQLRSYDFQVEF